MPVTSGEQDNAEVTEYRSIVTGNRDNSVMKEHIKEFENIA